MAAPFLRAWEHLRGQGRRRQQLDRGRGSPLFSGGETRTSALLPSC